MCHKLFCVYPPVPGERPHGHKKSCGWQTVASETGERER